MFLNTVVRKCFTEVIILTKIFKTMSKLSGIWEKSLWADEITTTKIFRLNHFWHVQETARRSGWL